MNAITHPTACSAYARQFLSRTDLYVHVAPFVLEVYLYLLIPFSNLFFVPASDSDTAISTSLFNFVLSSERVLFSLIPIQ